MTIVSQPVKVSHIFPAGAPLGVGRGDQVACDSQMTRMRINIALPGLEGLAGGMRVAAQYAAHLSSRGHTVTLLVRRPDPVFTPLQRARRKLGLGLQMPPLPDRAGHFEGLGLPVVHLDENRRLRHKQVPDADVVLSTWWTTTEWAARLPRSKGRHVHFIQDYEFFDRRVRNRVKAVYGRTHDRIVVASWLQHILREHHGKSSIVVPNGVDSARFSFALRGKGEPGRIGFLYSRHPRKNVSLAIDALELARVANPSLQAFSFGTKPRPSDLPQWIEYEQRPGQDRIPQIYAACDLWLFPSESEGFGLPLLEAMASGTPVLATRAGAAPDLVDGANGWLVEAEPQLMARGILEFLAQSEDQWQAASQAARHTAEVHDLANAAQAFENTLLSLIAQN